MSFVWLGAEERSRNYRYKSVGERINDFKEGREAISEARYKHSVRRLTVTVDRGRCAPVSISLKCFWAGGIESENRGA